MNKKRNYNNQIEISDETTSIVEEKDKLNKKRSSFIKEAIIKILVLILLILLIGITSFRTGNKYYLLKNMYFNETSPANVESGVARWCFDARVINIVNYERSQDETN